jgi:hypothetical protein
MKYGLAPKVPMIAGPPIRWSVWSPARRLTGLVAGLVAAWPVISPRSLAADPPVPAAVSNAAPAGALASGFLAADYTIVAQLPPGDADGFFMAPSLAKLPNGHLVAAVCHGRAYADGGKSLRSLRFYRSTDRGATWRPTSELPHDSCEPNLVVHEGKLYLLITPNGNNAKPERSNFPRDGKWGLWTSVSEDEGVTWSPIRRVIEGPSGPGTKPTVHNTGGQTAALIRHGKLYLSLSHQFEKMGIACCRLDQGILEPSAWRISEMVELPIPRELVYEPFHGPTPMRVLEGNVVEVSGRLLVIARTIINGGGTANMGAVFEIVDRADEPLTLRFLQLHPIPGGQLKFYIQYDAPSRMYWMASNLTANPAFLADDGAWRKAREINTSKSDRRNLMLWYSLDSLNWFPAGWIARAQGWTQSFHYPVMLVDGDDLVLISRTGRSSGNQHDVDLATFHRIKNFRKLAVDLTPTFPEEGK